MRQIKLHKTQPSYLFLSILFATYIVVLMAIFVSVSHARSFAEIDGNNEVKRVIVCDSEQWCKTNLGGTWVETYKDLPDRNFAGIGFTYYSEKQNFSSPKPYPSWTLSNDCKWMSPVPYPTKLLSNQRAVWNEKNIKWDIINKSRTK